MLSYMERRQHRRVPAHVKSLVRVNSHEVEGETRDLSLSGARIESSIVIQPGRQIAVKLVVPGDDTPILIEQARVQWNVDRTFGVRFVDLQPQELNELEQLINDSIMLDDERQS
ncbi:MAG: PilZ domain-containing protein [Nitrospira sp.]|nr:PilZ domain-containing protein [Nitrospira sp.]